MSEGPAELRAIIEEFKEMFDDMERYESLFEMGKQLDTLPTEQCTKETRVVGCQSEAHVSAEMRSTGFHLRGASDSQIVQGLMMITSIALEGLTPEAVTGVSPEFVAEMGLMQTLTTSRANGFLNMFMKVQDQARAMMG